MTEAPKAATLLDRAHMAMAAGGEAEALAFYRALADAPLFLLLEREAEGERIAPRVFDLPDGPVILACDSEERLSDLWRGMAGEGAGPVPYAVLPGRIIAAHLAGQGVSVGLNFQTGAASETLLPPEALRFLSDTVESASVAEAPVERQPESLYTPDLPEALRQALNFTFDGAGGLARTAWLAGVRYDDGTRGLVLAIEGALPQAEAPLARAVAEALAFSGLDAAALDVTFLPAGDPALRALSRAGHMFEFPPPPAPPETAAPAAPGTDPDRPPRLR